MLTPSSSSKRALSSSYISPSVGRISLSRPRASPDHGGGGGGTFRVSPSARKTLSPQFGSPRASSSQQVTRYQPPLK